MDASLAKALRHWRDGQQSLGRLLEQLVFIGVLLLLLWLPLPFGSARPWSASLFSLLVFALLGLWCLSLALSDFDLRQLKPGVAVPATLWVLWLSWIWLQSQAWPLAWITALSPHRWQHLVGLSALTGQPVSAAPPSLDAGATAAQLLLSSAYAGLFLLLVLALRRRARFQWLLWVLVVSGIAQALYGMLMVLSGLEYGAWGPKQAYRGFATGTFVNRNHFAGYLEISVAAAVGLIMAQPIAQASAVGWRQRLRRLLALLQDGRLFVRACIALFFLALILSQSRMGNVAAVAGLSIAGLLTLLVGRERAPARWLLLLGSILLIDIWLFGHWFGLDQLAERFAQVQDQNPRSQVYQDLKRMIPVYAWTGSGLGTFEMAYPEFRSPEVQHFYNHAHNDYAQFLIETGVIGASPLGLLVLVTMARALLILRRRHDPLVRGIACAGLVAIAALAVHSAADFNLQIPANAATLVALMAAVWAASPQPRRRRATQTGHVTIAAGNAGC